MSGVSTRASRPTSFRIKRRQSVVAAVVVACATVVALPSAAFAISAPSAFGFKAYSNGVLLTWSKVSGATSYQIKVRKTSQNNSAGYVFTLGANKTTFRLKKYNFPDYHKPGGYIFTLCAANSSGRSCASIGARPATTGTMVSTANRQAAVAKANSCFDDAADAFVVTGSVGLVSLLIPGAGELTGPAIGAIAAATAGATYVMCALRISGDEFATDDSQSLSSPAGDFSGGGGGGGGGGGSWRTAGRTSR